MPAQPVACRIAPTVTPSTYAHMSHPYALFGAAPVTTTVIGAVEAFEYRTPKLFVTERHDWPIPTPELETDQTLDWQKSIEQC